MRGDLYRLCCICRQLALTRADQTPSRAGRHHQGRSNSLQQSAEASDTPTDPDSSLKVDSSDTPNAQAGGSAHQPGISGTSSLESQDCGANAAGDLASEECLKGIEFLDNLKNASNLQPVALPLQLKLFSRIPVVVSARLFGQTGMPSETFARLFVK